MRSEGFERMDVSTSIDDDPKFRALARRHPELYATALAAYVGLLARSWREGERLTLEEGWPALLPFDQATAEAMAEAGLVTKDDDMRLPAKAWGAWYEAAVERREKGRERRRRSEAKHPRVRLSDRQDSQTGQQEGQTDSPSVRQTGPTFAGRPPDVRRASPNGVDLSTCPGCGELLHPGDAGVVAGRGGQLWHRECPSKVAP